jgi:putative transcriptional regulator
MPKTKKEKIVADRLYELRVENELTQEQLAKASGIDRKTVNRIENGHFAPNLDTLFRLCDAIGVKPAELLKGL